MKNKLLSFLGKYGIYLVLAVAAVIRLAQVRTVFYGTTSEMYRDLNLVLDMFQTKRLILFGPHSSLGAFNFGPVYYYLLAPFVYLFHFKSWAVLVCSAFFSLLEIYVLFRLMLLWTGNKMVALLAGALCAVSMFDIQNAYYISNPNLMPFFTLVVLYNLTLLLQDRWAWYNAVIFGAALGIDTQLHATALFILPIVIIICVFIFRKKLFLTVPVSAAGNLLVGSKRLHSPLYQTLQDALLAFAALIMTWIPYLYYEFTTGFKNASGVVAISGHTFKLLPQWHSIVFVFNIFYDLFFFRNAYFDLIFSSPKLYTALAAALIILLSTAIVFLLRKLKENKFKPDSSDSRGARSERGLVPLMPAGRVILLAWLAVTAVTFVFFSTTSDFYLLILWPAPLILLTFLLAWLYRNYRWLFAALFSFFVIVQIVHLLFFFHQFSSEQYNFENLQQMFANIRTDAGGASFRVVSYVLDPNTTRYVARISGFPDPSGVKYVYFIQAQGDNSLPDIPADYSFQQRISYGKYYQAAKFVRK